jgi:hypothetical protein
MSSPSLHHDPTQRTGLGPYVDTDLFSPIYNIEK